MSGLKVVQEIQSAALYKGEVIELYLHDAPHGFEGKERGTGTVRISVSVDENGFVVEKSGNVKVKDFECV
jgi:hypothetical protein